MNKNEQQRWRWTKKIWVKQQQREQRKSEWTSRQINRWTRRRNEIINNELNSKAECKRERKEI